jgi:ubiquinone/menaquinone biosynthesis C-methylase UbiE
MIERARERNKSIPNATFLINDGKTLPLQNSSVDAVFCELAFQHMKKHTVHLYINDVFRVLLPGGVFIAQIPRLDYYQDKSFAWSKEEASYLMSDYKTEWLDSGAAYYLAYATKVE